jgi:G:T-mismatch repair DNA endonuclease (very short patch repair protein)
MEFLKWQGLRGWSSAPDSYLFPSRQDQPFTLNGIQKRFKGAVKSAGLKNCYSIHACRHTYGLALYAKSRNLRLVQQQLGHVSIRTAELYLTTTLVDTDKVNDLWKVDKYTDAKISDKLIMDLITDILNVAELCRIKCDRISNSQVCRGRISTGNGSCRICMLLPYGLEQIRVQSRQGKEPVGISVPNTPEAILKAILEWLYTNEGHLKYKYVGSGGVNIGSMEGVLFGHGRYKKLYKRCRPDFLNEENRKVIEMFGDYWHSRRLRGIPEVLEERRKKRFYKIHGYRCLVIWESELNEGNRKRLLEKLIKFHKE